MLVVEDSCSKSSVADRVAIADGRSYTSSLSKKVGLIVRPQVALSLCFECKPSGHIGLGIKINYRLIIIFSRDRI